MGLGGVTVVIMFVLFGFSQLTEADEREHRLEEKAVRFREQLLQAARKAIALADKASLQAVAAHLDGVRDRIAAALDDYQRELAALRAGQTEARRDEDELVRAALQRRQQQLAALPQRLSQAQLLLDRAKADVLKLGLDVPPAPRPTLAPREPAPALRAPVTPPAGAR